VLPEYKYSSKRLLLIDLEDTLWTRKNAEGIIKPGTPFDVPQNVLDMLNRLQKTLRTSMGVEWTSYRWGDGPHRGEGLESGSCESYGESRISIYLISSLSAENGCFIKTIQAKVPDNQWISMVANFTSPGRRPVWKYSITSPNVPLDPTSRKEKPLSCGGSGVVVPKMQQIDSGLCDRLRRLRTIYLTGEQQSQVF